MGLGDILQRARSDEASTKQQDEQDDRPVGKYAHHRDGQFDEPRYTDRWEPASPVSAPPFLSIIDEYVAEPGTIEDISYTGSPVPGSLSTGDGDIAVLIDTYRDDDTERRGNGQGNVGNFYTRDGDVRVIVNEWPEGVGFEEVEARLRNQANFYSRNGGVTITPGEAACASGVDLPEDRPVPEGLAIQPQILELETYRERRSYSTGDLLEFWQGAVQGTRDDTKKYIHDAKRRFESDTIPVLHGAGVVDIGDTVLDELSLKIHDQEMGIGDWYDQVEAEDSIVYKAVVPYKGFGKSVTDKNMYETLLVSVASGFVEAGIREIEERAAQGPETFLDETQFNGTSAWHGHVPNLLRRSLEADEANVTLQDGELVFTAEADYSLDIGLLGLLPYRDELEEHGAELADLLGEPAGQETRIEDINQLSPDVRNRLEQLEEHNLIKYDADIGGATLYTSNYNGGKIGGESIDVSLSAEWNVDNIAVPGANEQQFYRTLLLTFNDLIGSLDEQFPALEEDRQDLVRLHLYRMLEDILEVSEEAKTAHVSHLYDAIHENMISDRLLDYGVRGTDDMHVAIGEYVDRS